MSPIGAGLDSFSYDGQGIGEGKLELFVLLSAAAGTFKFRLYA